MAYHPPAISFRPTRCMLVILNELKNLINNCLRSFASAQDDNSRRAECTSFVHSANAADGEVFMCRSEPASLFLQIQICWRSHYTASPVLRPTYNYNRQTLSDLQLQQADPVRLPTTTGRPCPTFNYNRQNLSDLRISLQFRCDVERIVRSAKAAKKRCRRFDPALVSVQDMAPGSRFRSGIPYLLAPARRLPAICR